MKIISGKNHKQIFFKAVTNALNGCFHFFSFERNGKIQGVITLIMLIAAIVFQISSIEWIIVLLCISAVLALEMMNSALEHLCNLVYSDYNASIKIIKDVSAGAVLLASVVSVIIGAIIFLPKIFAFL